MEETFILIFLMVTSCLPTCCTWHEIYACPHRDRDTILEVKCKTNNVLANIQVMSRHYSRNCTGSPPNLLAAVNNCYWGRNCSLPYAYSLNQIERCEQRFGGEESHQANAKTLLVGENLCIHKRKVLNICDAKKKPRVKGGSIQPGIIRSHDLYPWYYDNTLQNKTCTQRIDLDYLGTKKILVVGVRTHILCEKDELILTRSDQEYDIVNSSIPEVPFSFSAKYSHVDVSFHSGSKPGCSGFIVCYKALSKKQHRRFLQRGGHVCDMVANRSAQVTVVVGDTYEIECEGCKKKCKRRRRHMDAEGSTTNCCCNDSQCMDINAAQMGGN